MSKPECPAAQTQGGKL